MQARKTRLREPLGLLLAQQWAALVTAQQEAGRVGSTRVTAPKAFESEGNLA